MRQGCKAVSGEFIEIVDRGQSARIEFAKDHAFGKSPTQRKFSCCGKLLQPLADHALVARAEVDNRFRSTIQSVVP